ncbi:hypothetical protein ACERK3_02785 [Phycisphaerales bacterium AB-hyl4]|uniref:Uncharacterized protein n=1 Tax=Natronomicrosphaera hydrolytica TaxID=3242702 RepID=A0ABV4U0T4_9BACT
MTFFEWLCLGFSLLFLVAMLVALVGYVVRLFREARPHERKRTGR